MSGHNKWSTIKRKKGAADSKRSKIFSKIIREITVAARGGADPAGNSRLRRALDAARAANMPNDNIERAIKKAAGGEDGSHFDEFTLEAYGPHGIALLMEVMTDNRNRTLPEVRHIFSRNGGSLGEPGCVAWMFEKKGVLRFPKEKYPNEDQMMERVLEAGAEDLRDGGEMWEVVTDPHDFDTVVESFKTQGHIPVEAELTSLPKNSITIGAKEAEQLFRLIDALEDQDDVQNVYSNMDVSDADMQSLMGE